jgi:hypothetical protein
MAAPLAAMLLFDHPSTLTHESVAGLTVLQHLLRQCIEIDAQPLRDRHSKRNISPEEMTELAVDDLALLRSLDALHRANDVADRVLLISVRHQPEEVPGLPNPKGRDVLKLAAADR